MASLLPCPFCGGHAKTVYIRDGRKAMCQSCHAAGAPEFNGRPDQPSANQRAIEAWNRRAVNEAKPVAAFVDADGNLSIPEGSPLPETLRSLPEAPVGNACVALFLRKTRGE